jgi:hypothetical protein
LNTVLRLKDESRTREKSTYEKKLKFFPKPSQKSHAITKANFSKCTMIMSGDEDALRNFGFPKPKNFGFSSIFRRFWLSPV